MPHGGILLRRVELRFLGDPRLRLPPAAGSKGEIPTDSTMCHNISVKTSLSPMLSVRKGAKAVEILQFCIRSARIIRGENMNSKFNLMLTAAAILLFIGSDARMAHAQGNKKASDSGCPVLTSAMVEKVLGQPVKSSPAEKALSMYGGASGWSCTYGAGSARINFSVYTEASSEEARREFDKYSIAADDSKGKPSIGDSAYWVTATKQQLYLYVLKGKVHFSIGMRPPNETQMKNLASAAVAGI